MACLGVGVRPLAHGFPHASTAPSTTHTPNGANGQAAGGRGSAPPKGCRLIHFPTPNGANGWTAGGRGSASRTWIPTCECRPIHFPASNEASPYGQAGQPGAGDRPPHESGQPGKQGDLLASPMARHPRRRRRDGARSPDRRHRRWLARSPPTQRGPPRPHLHLPPRSWGARWVTNPQWA